MKYSKIFMAVAAAGVAAVFVLSGILAFQMVTIAEPDTRIAGTAEEGIMVITYEKATGRLASIIPSYQSHESIGGLVYIYGADARAIIDPARVGYSFFPNQLFEIPLECGPDSLECYDAPINIQDLDLDPLSAEDLPFSTHYAIVTDISPGLARPAGVTRRWHDQNYFYRALISEAVKDLYISGNITIGDYVIVSFIEEHPSGTEYMIPVVIDKVVKTWQ